MTQVDLNSTEIQTAIRHLIELSGEDSSTFEGELVAQLIYNSLKLIKEGHGTGQVKLMTRALKEMRYAYRIFNQYQGVKRISIFGSARTPEDHPDYQAAREFSAGMASHHWMCITGAANGIMKAGLEGPKRESSFGLSIRLPFEMPANPFIEGDSKLIIFRYFFTRKLMFLSHSDAVAVFPGGVGTLDELFEVLTLIQTGKGAIVPVVLIEGEGRSYWKEWDLYIQNNLLKNGWISPEDRCLYYIAGSPEDGVAHIQKFYSRYHSSRYVNEMLVIRLKENLTPAQIKILNQKFSSLLEAGEIHETPPFPEETDHLDLPRIAFWHHKKEFSLVRALIDEINAF